MSYKFSKKKFCKVASIKNFDVLFYAYRFVDGMFIFFSCFQSSAEVESWSGVENGFGVDVFFGEVSRKGEAN